MHFPLHIDFPGPFHLPALTSIPPGIRPHGDSRFGPSAFVVEANILVSSNWPVVAPATNLAARHLHLLNRCTYSIPLLRSQFSAMFPVLLLCSRFSATSQVLGLGAISGHIVDYVTTRE